MSEEPGCRPYAPYRRALGRHRRVDITPALYQQPHHLRAFVLSHGCEKQRAVGVIIRLQLGPRSNQSTHNFDPALGLSPRCLCQTQRRQARRPGYTLQVPLWEAPEPMQQVVLVTRHCGSHQRVEPVHLDGLGISTRLQHCVHGGRICVHHSDHQGHEPLRHARQVRMVLALEAHIDACFDLVVANQRLDGRRVAHDSGVMKQRKARLVPGDFVFPRPVQLRLQLIDGSRVAPGKSRTHAVGRGHAEQVPREQAPLQPPAVLLGVAHAVAGHHYLVHQVGFD
mmetsp:Transcript_62842/g.164775  ORF Transcript_62842/g.164775 Transcript_62842/m.164775 type:complete len:282 (+) Transcript_62842:656-1501(+)